MAEDTPSLKGAFDILHQAGQDKLLYLKHKLKAPRPGSKASNLLYAMVLLTLGQKTEARIVLDSLRGDKVALSVARTWEGTEPLNQEDLLPSQEQADIPLAVARIYQLLEEEKLCESSSRNQAYQAALQALSLCHDARLPSILAEAQSLCGLDIHGAGSFQMLRSDVGCLPVSSAPASRVSSHPWPIRARSDLLATESFPLSLRSTGSPASFASNLDISQSPTLPFLTHQLQKRSPRGPSKLCGDPQTNSNQASEPLARQEPEEMSWPCSDPAASLPVQLNSSASVISDHQAPSSSIPSSPTIPVAPETSVHSPVECLEALSDAMSLQPASMKPAETLVSSEDFGALPGLSPMSVPPSGEGKATPLSVQESDFPKKAAGPRPPVSTQDPSPSPSSSLSSGPELDTGQRFFSFVILHAQEDEAIALRVRDTLESLGVPDGTTFCEEFQVPGRFELRCLQDAIDNSAFTVLLLTRHFDCRMSLHQVHMALMNSLTRSEKENSVIPFFPRESTLKSAKVSSLLTGLVSLDESSPVFSKKVSSTFNRRRLQAQREVWKKQQEIRAIQEQTQQMAEDRERVLQKENALSDLAYHYNLLHKQLQSLTMAFPNQMSFAQGYRMPMSHPWAHSLSPHFATAPSAFQPNQFIPSMPFPPVPSSARQPDPQSAGAQPLIIHNAHMVQLGLNNYMWGRREGQGPSEEERTERE
ncbi:TIR domain-containing adapter molecule 1 [Trichosurus vulpecula]|uniref:TIR domain-containing adapter molecule 1 n=1 Tax=Trichosurus vulpecula TaxID=9337 RepID=UPI00186ACFB6|nr:TIR domain-containing adapter molecule 1 [Trichosurus vulpecula]XP_036618491.1 TIR domain-containing adapter molecule 1 [Trichosurus vulpecula]XP_036618499.1 TIR domain-containing adapter molecule 1 [Trichosurus vulpecula]XP_036618507.1 TIR domain-containing adapter molecule 1 [Trichosurus vulpecula]